MIWKNSSLIATAALMTLLSTTSVAIANPAPIGSPGNSLVPFALKPIAGVSIAEETLLIEDGKTDTIPSVAPGGGTQDVPCVRYQAKYQFENKTGKSKTVKVGFPVIAYSTIAGGSYGGLTSLTATYNDKTLDVKQSSHSRPMIFPNSRVAEIIKELKTAGVTRRVAESSDFVDLSKLGGSLKSAKNALRKSKRLNEKQTSNCLKVLKRIAFVNGGSDDTLTQQSLLWYTFEIPLPVGLSKTLTVSYNSFMPYWDDYSFSYILSTARFWNNQSKRIRVEIEPDRAFLKKDGRYEILPHGKFILSQNSGRYIFQSENRAPNFDLYVKRISDHH